MCLIILARTLERVERVQGRGLVNALINGGYKTRLAVAGTVATVAYAALIAGLVLADKRHGGNTQSTSATPSTGGAHGVPAWGDDSGGDAAAGHGGGSKLHL